MAFSLGSLNPFGERGILNPSGSNFLGRGDIYGNAGEIPAAGQAPGDPTIPEVVAPNYRPQQSAANQNATALLGESIKKPTVAPQLDRAQINMGRGLEMGARGEQANAVGLIGQAATGNAPSVAAAQQSAGLDAAIRSQAALANSARGNPAARAATMRAAGANVADLQQRAVNDAAMLRANEMATARGQYAGAATALRGADQGLTGQEIGVAQANAANELASRGLNNEQIRALLGLGIQGEQLQQNDRQFGQTLGMDAQRLGVERGLGIMGQNTQRLVPGAANALQVRGGILSAISGGVAQAVAKGGAG